MRHGVEQGIGAIKWHKFFSSRIPHQFWNTLDKGIIKALEWVFSCKCFLFFEKTSLKIFFPISLPPELADIQKLVYVFGVAVAAMNRQHKWEYKLNVCLNQFMYSAFFVHTVVSLDKFIRSKNCLLKHFICDLQKVSSYVCWWCWARRIGRSSGQNYWHHQSFLPWRVPLPWNPFPR